MDHNSGSTVLIWMISRTRYVYLMSIYSRENGFSSYYSNVGREKKEKKEKKKNCFHCISESTQIMWMIMGTRYVYRMIIYS